MASDEIRDDRWQFDADSVTRMLSPKLLKDNAHKEDPHPPLSAFTCLVEDDAVREILCSMPTPGPVALVSAKRPNYPPLATFFNSCVSNCNTAYDELRTRLSSHSRFHLKHRSDRWWPVLEFFEYDREMKDGIEGAAPLKPGIIAGSGPNGTGELAGYWSMPATPVPGGMEVLLAVEVKDNWEKLVREGREYARAHLLAMPLRLFSLVVGVNHKTHKLRFLIYHRGGLTASHEIDLDQEEGRRKVQQIMFSVLLWQKPEDAGFPPFMNGVDYDIPSGGDSSTHIVMDKVLHNSLSVHGRGTFVVRGIPKSSAGATHGDFASADDH